uniref:Venom peptide n=1 Tax=Steinernema glaseri TaxID=37863 RepID=A0A1I7YZZ2_9BILA
MRLLFVLLVIAGCYAAHKIRDNTFQIQGIEVSDEIPSRERRQVNQNYVRPSFGR